MRSSDEALSAEEIATSYKALYEARAGLAGSQVDNRPCGRSPTRREDRIRAHVQHLRNELERLHLVTMATSEGTCSQRSELTPAQRAILSAAQGARAAARTSTRRSARSRSLPQSEQATAS